MANFKPRARLLKLLGEQLIGTPQLAIFELVKNGYDADADRVEVRLFNPENLEEGRIEVTDINGIGMTRDIIENIWLEPGADHKKNDKESGFRTEKYNRLPLGEKGVGRFAVHKLGKKIELITRSKDSKELSLIIDWEKLDEIKYMEDFSVEVIENNLPVVFNENKTGTKIIISNLNGPISRSDVRNLHRNIESIKTPFEQKSFKLDSSVPVFDVTLSVDGKPEWTDDLYDIVNIINQSMFRFAFFFNAGKWSWSYEFTPNEQLIKELNISPNKLSSDDEFFEFSSKEKIKRYKLESFSDLGQVFGEIYVFDFDKGVRDFYLQTGVVKTFLSENKGVRVYRDGVRVYNYGEPHDDWLELDGRRVDKLGIGLNRNITVGGISVDLENTPMLIEKTNREGFIENETFFKFRDVVESSLSKLEKLRDIDKKRLRNISNVDAKSSIANIENPIDELRKISKEKNIDEIVEPRLIKIEKSYNQMRDIMLNAGMAGLNMTIAFHEIHRGVKDTRKAVETEIDKEIILNQFDRFEVLLDTYAKMLKKEPVKEYSIKKLLKGNVELADVRFKMHDIVISCPVLVGDHDDSNIKIPKHLMTSVINTLIDNSIYWLDQRWGMKEANKKYIHIGVNYEFDTGPAIVIADNGAGWKGVSPEEVVQPFLTTKPGGMGIGLYYANTVMEMIGGELVVLEPGDLELPDAVDGAIVALVFKGIN